MPGPARTTAVDTTALTGLWEACIFATKSHGLQTRRSGEPYILHPMSVTKHLLDLPELPPLYVCFAAVLHDVLEDTDVLVDTLIEVFGNTVAGLVVELTNDKVQLTRLGKTAYLCQKVSMLSKYAVLIKLADRYDNLLDIQHASTNNARSAEYARGTWLMLQVIGQRPLGTRAEGHDVLVSKIEKLLTSAGYAPPADTQ